MPEDATHKTKVEQMDAYQAVLNARLQLQTGLSGIPDDPVETLHGVDEYLERALEVLEDER